MIIRQGERIMKKKGTHANGTLKYTHIKNHGIGGVQYLSGTSS